MMGLESQLKSHQVTQPAGCETATRCASIRHSPLNRYRRYIMEQHPQRIGAAGNQKDAGMSDVRPRLAIIAVAVWALFQTARITSLPIIQSVLAGDDSTAWLYPAFIDLFIGITAPFVAFAMWRKTGLWVWVVALMWFTTSLFDHMDAIVAALISRIPQAFFGGNQSAVLTSLVISAVLDVTCLVVLTRGKMRSHYLGSIGSGEGRETNARLSIIIIVVWALLQLPRFIAIPLIQNVLAGHDPAAWLWPAIGDIVIATTAPFVAFAVWRKTGLWVWVGALLWFILSILDHLSTITAALTTPGPQ